MTELNGASAVVTGGAMGIGLATARRLLKENCSVTIWDIHDEYLRTAEKELQLIGAPVYCRHCDITDETQVNQMAAMAKREMGSVDILINNAGCVVPGRFCTQPPAVRVKETYVNLISMYYTIYAFLPGMLERDRGHVVNISSGAGLLGMPDLAVYCATKWAVSGFTEALRFEAECDRKKGVRFSSVHPGIIKQGLFEGSKLNLLGEILIPRVKDHDHIAKAIVNRALKKNRRVVKHPRSLHLGVLTRGLLPDRVMGNIMLLAGAGRIMKDWKGHDRSRFPESPR